MAQAVAGPISRLPTFLLGKILGYDLDRESVIQRERVSKSFKEAIPYALQGEWYKLNADWRIDPLGARQIPEAVRKISEYQPQIRERLRTWQPPALPPAPGLLELHQNLQITAERADLLWAEMSATFKDDPQLYPQLVRRWFGFYYHLDLHAKADPMDLDVTYRHAVRSAIPESLNLRVRRIRTLHGLNPDNRDQIKRCFLKLQEEQHQALSQGMRAGSNFPRAPLTFTVRNFDEMEALVQANLSQADKDLSSMWNNIRVESQILGVPIPPDAPQTTALAKEIRDYLNNPANQPYFDKIDTLYFGPQFTHLGAVRPFRPVVAIPPEVVKLRYLTYLCFGGACELPSFLSELRYLYDIRTHNGGPAFQVRYLSDALYRHMEADFNLMEYEAGGLTFECSYLKEVPFRMWFKNNFALPQFSFSLFLAGCLDALTKGGAGGLIEALSYVASPLIVSLMLFDLAFNAAVFLINLLLIDVVEPLITLWRDKRGYPRMVKIG